MKLSSISILALSAVAAAQPRRRQHPHPAKRQAVDIVTNVVTATEAAAVVFVDPNGTPLSTSFAAGQPGPTVAPEAVGANGLLPPPAGPPSPQPQVSPHQKNPHPKNAHPPKPTSQNQKSKDVHPQNPRPKNPHPQNSLAPNAHSKNPHSHKAQPQNPNSPPAPGPSQPANSPPNSATPPPPANSGPAGGGSAPQGSLGYGLAYSPYTSSGACKTQDQVHADFGGFSGYGFVRSYGTDCDQVNTMLNAAKAKGMKMIAGIFDIPQVQSETQALIAAAKNDWDSIDTVVVGNEAVISGMASVDQVVSAVNQARSMLQAAGYNGKVVTVETSGTIIDNPQLCQASDFPAANCHAFFNSDMTPDKAGPWVKEQAQRVSAACGGKQAMITESGWPWQGNTNGAAVPSPQNQQTAINSLRGSFSDNIILFSAFNDAWKTNNPSTFNAEQFWGIYGNAPS